MLRRKQMQYQNRRTSKWRVLSPKAKVLVRFSTPSKCKNPITYKPKKRKRSESRMKRRKKSMTS